MKYAIFDFDGTLTQNGNSWERIFNYYNDGETDNKFYKRFKNKEINYEEWFELVKNRFCELGVNLSLMQTIANMTPVNSDVYPLFNTLFERNIKIIVLSGGVKNIINIILKNCLDCIHLIEGSLFIFDKNNILSSIIPPNHKPNDKADFIEALIKKEDLLKDDIIFIGNGDNDEIVAKTGVKMVCINPENTNPNDKNIWNHSIDNLMDVLKYIN